VDFVDEEKRAAPLPAADLRGFEGLSEFSDAREDCTYLNES
jgi:hypothetical protein